MAASNLFSSGLAVIMVALAGLHCK
jgi:hypothetical protein